MPTPIPPPPPRDPPAAPPQSDPAAAARRFRFSVRTALLVTTVLAIGCGVAKLIPYGITLLLTGATWIAGASWLATGVLFGRGDRQAFCVGGSIVVLSMWSQAGGQLLEGVRTLLRPLGLFGLGDSFTPWLELLIVAAAVVGNGLLCVRARRWHQSTNQ
ncbi:MAG: hypothetical protein KDA44_09150 [Planctomycetales bacterium]|nr:hypothetical protein [Planctomycetales bacterium]